MTGPAFAAAALALRGVRFRLNGRHAESGLDCLGVVAAALAACGRPAVGLPRGYALRSSSYGDPARWAQACGFVAAAGPCRAGDVLLVACSKVQLHVLVALGDERFVHAHAGLRRVVVGPRDPAWAVVGHWRPDDPDRG